MARRVILITFEVLGVEVGHWCNQCLVSSGIRVWYVNAIGLSMCFHSSTACRDCDQDDVELVEHSTTVWRS